MISAAHLLFAILSGFACNMLFVFEVFSHVDYGIYNFIGDDSSCKCNSSLHIIY